MFKYINHIGNEDDKFGLRKENRKIVTLYFIVVKQNKNWIWMLIIDLLQVQITRDIEQ